MNLLLQPDPTDPRKQFYDHPVDAGSLHEHLAELARLGWRQVGRPRTVLVEGRQHVRYRLTRESKRARMRLGARAAGRTKRH